MKRIGNVYELLSRNVYVILEVEFVPSYKGACLIRSDQDNMGSGVVSKSASNGVDKLEKDVESVE